MNGVNASGASAPDPRPSLSGHESFLDWCRSHRETHERRLEMLTSGRSPSSDPLARWRGPDFSEDMICQSRHIISELTRLIESSAKHVG
jgi:hypothetical protein